MMLRFRAHRRFRERLSTYIDAELPAREQLELEAHLDTCSACRDEIEELRTISRSVAGLPSADVPRSFRLTPADVAPTRGTAPAFEQGGARSLNLGLRYAGGVLAAALAAVLVLDAGGVIGENDSGNADNTAAVAERAAIISDEKAQAGYDLDSISGSPAAPPDTTTAAPVEAWMEGIGAAGPTPSPQPGNGVRGAGSAPAPTLEPVLPTDEPDAPGQGAATPTGGTDATSMEAPAAAVTPGTGNWLAFGGQETADAAEGNDEAGAADRSDSNDETEPTAVALVEFALAILLVACIIGLVTTVIMQRRVR